MAKQKMSLLLDFTLDLTFAESSVAFIPLSDLQYCFNNSRCDCEL